MSPDLTQGGPIYGPFISRKQAQQQGLTYYFTGKPCKHGHIAKRRVDRPECGECYRIRATAKSPIAEPRICSRCKCQFVPVINAKRVRFCSSACYQEFHNAKRRTNEYRALARQRNAANREGYNARKRAAYARRADHYRASSRARYNPEKNAVRSRRFFAQNPDYRKNYESNRYQDDPSYRLTKCLRARLHAIVRRDMGAKTGATFDLLSCTLAELQTHLETQFTEGMSWNNFGQWHIDHIRPCASFDLTDPAQQRECFHFSNLQPLWAADNMRKNDKWEPVAA